MVGGGWSREVEREGEKWARLSCGYLVLKLKYQM